MKQPSTVVSSAGELMSKPDIVLRHTDILADAIRVCRHPSDLIVVLDKEDCPIGYVDSAILLEALLKKVSMHETLDKISKKDFIIYAPDEPVQEKLGMSGQAPVFVCQDNHFKGLISRNSILSYYKWQNEVYKGFKGLMEKYECILNHCEDSILLFDGSGSFVWGNTSSLDITEHLKFRNIYELENDLLFFPSIVRSILEDWQPRTIIQHGSNGHTMLVTGNPIFDKDGKLTWIVTVNRDIDCLAQQLDTFLYPQSTPQESMERISARFSEEAEKIRLLYDEMMVLRQNNQEPKTIITSSNKKMQRVVQQAERIARVDSSVLLLGESGVGKDVIATNIHKKSLRSGAAFVRVNCGAIPENLFESELFGYEQGAFTGAKRRKIGFFELANHGTLFLDEIAEMPPAMQVKLLHVLQNHAFYRVGGSNLVNVDTRIISATNKDLGEMVAKGTFREDLYYRLNVIPLTIPPVRERREDIPIFIMHFLKIFNQRYQRECQFSLEAMQLLINYDWPGNVRQLENTIERLVITAGGDVIYPYELPPDILALEPEEEPFCEQSLSEAVKHYERKIIQDAFERYGNISKVAQVLGVNRSTIYRKLNWEHDVPETS